MTRHQHTAAWMTALGLIVFLHSAGAGEPEAASAQAEAERAVFRLLDAPLLFVKRHSYTGIHIYDTYYKWPPGGGGIYVLENPQAPRSEWKIRPVIDPTTPGTLGLGVYTHPELSWDATKLLFCFKGEPNGSTSIYEIGIDGKGLRRLTNPEPTCDAYKGSHAGQHDIAPAYLPDGRIVFLSTRPSGLVPCNNTGVAILHRMNADGSDIHPISVNNVNEFDPSVMPDGRILFGRWEYVDKNALTIQSLWTCNPDGTQETAVYANNMVFPEAVLDARPVPNSHLIVGTFAKHNAPPRGSIAMIDPRRGKNDPAAAFNFEHPDDATYDRGDSCEPWPLSEDIVLFSGRPAGQKRNVIEWIDRTGRRGTLLSDPDICLHSPMLVKPRPRPLSIADTIDRRATTGRFFVQDIYRGLEGVKRGEIRWLRVIEETSRVSPTMMGGSPYNQTFLVSCALAFSVKNYLGVVPVEPDGSAYFEVPSGRALYFQALDADGRLVQGMRTFVQAAPGATRSCIGCHENKYSAAANAGPRNLLGREPHRPKPESWGSGFLDYPSMVQPILDRHCASCHGGEKDIAAGIDLTGGWTEHFNISYENLTSRRQTQLVAYWIAGIDCMNGTAFGSAPLFPARSFGSGAAPLAKLLLDGHNGNIPNLSRQERDLLMAWIDSNGLYHGTWDQTEHGCAVRNWSQIRAALTARMQAAGCLKCHGEGDRLLVFENDWINLKDPPLSRILRAPMAKGEGLGLGLCRDRKVDPRRQRIRLLVKGYAHAVQPLEAFAPQPIMPPDLSGQPVVSFASTNDPHYQAMLAIIEEGREKALAAPRVDMPGAEILPGMCRTFNPPPLPEIATPLEATLTEDGLVLLRTERSAQTIGLEAEFHRGDQEGFTPTPQTLLSRTALFQHTDNPATGKHFYAVVLASGARRSLPRYAAVTVPPPSAPPPPSALKVVPASGAIRLSWQAPRRPVAGYHVYRAKGDSASWTRITEQPLRERSYADAEVELHQPYSYTVRSVSLRGAESEPAPPLTASARVIREPVFVGAFQGKPVGLMHEGQPLAAAAHGPARCEGGVLRLEPGGCLTFPHHPYFDLGQPISLECWVFFEAPGEMPVILSCGAWRQSGWFLQRIGAGFRWHVGGIDCDGGRMALGKWIHLVGTYDGRSLKLFQDGVLVAETPGKPVTAVWPGELHVGQYSGGPGPAYQVVGRIAGVKLYHRALDAEEAASAAEPPSGQ
jgi:hypothetical protein